MHSVTGRLLILAIVNNIDNIALAEQDACEEWLSLLRADALKPHLTTVMKRFKEAVTDSHFLANLLHPKYKGKHLSKADEEAARQLFLKLYPEHPQVIADLHVLNKCRLFCGGRLCQTASAKCDHIS